MIFDGWRCDAQPGVRRCSAANSPTQWMAMYHAGCGPVAAPDRSPASLRAPEDELLDYEQDRIDAYWQDRRDAENDSQTNQENTAR